jgi:Tfp pilus assembly protein PilO
MATKMPRQSIIYLGICLAGVLLFVLLGIIPAWYSLGGMERKIQEKKFSVEEQKALLPLYESVKSRAVQKQPASLPLPAPGKLETARINLIPQTISQMARDNKLNMLSVTPDLTALADEGRRLPVEVTVTGAFADFRQFMIDLNALPYLDGTREVLIEQGPNGQVLKIKLLIAVM